MVQTCDFSTWEADKEGMTQIQGHSGHLTCVKNEKIKSSMNSFFLNGKYTEYFIYIEPDMMADFYNPSSYSREL